MQLIFGKCGEIETANADSDIISPRSSQQNEEDEIALMDPANEELRRRITQMLKKTTLDSEDKHCLQQLIQLVRHWDLMAQRSETNSLNISHASCTSDDANSLDMLKSRVSDYSSASSPSSARSIYEASNNHNSHQNFKTTTSKTSIPANTTLPSGARIVATVSPYNSSPQHSSSNGNGNSNQLVPTNTPTDSPRKSRQQSWQSNSLSESGVFVESDFLSDDVSEHNACTQTDFEEEEQVHAPESVAQAARELCNELQKLQRNNSEHTATTTKGKKANNYNNKAAGCYTPPSSNNSAQYSPNLSEQKRLQYYKERLALLESKVLIYESSGDLQAKRLADRLQREILLEKELKELRDRVEFLESENLTLEEEKCEFEEAENDTRLRLQRLEVELEILSQRNVELEVSREALSAKYKDCRSECLNLRDDLAASEQQICHLDEDKRKAKETLEILHNLLPLFLTYHTTLTLSQWAANANIGSGSECGEQTLKAEIQTSSAASECGEPTQTSTVAGACENGVESMGNALATPIMERMDEMLPECAGNRYVAGQNYSRSNNNAAATAAPEPSTCVCAYLKEEVKCLRHQIKELNSRHYEAMESADTHWVELERQYKDREEAYRAKECCLKSKIQKLQDCLRDDARAANEKICQLEEAENDLKNCLVRVSKEHRDLCDEHEYISGEYERVKEELAALKEQQKPTLEQLEQERKRSKALNDEVSFMRKLQQETEARNLAETEALHTQLYELKKEYLHIEVTNGELKEEVATLEQQIEKLQSNEKELEDKIRVLQDEVRSKEEMVLKLEKRLERSEGYSLAQELSGSPSKRFKREDVRDLKTASKGLGNALRNFKDCESSLPTHQQFSNVARDVKRLADSLLNGGSDATDDEVSINVELKSDEKTETESEPDSPELKTDEEAQANTINKLDIREQEVASEQEPVDEENGGNVVNFEQEPVNEANGDNEPPIGSNITIAMALMPHFFIDECLMPLSIEKPEEKSNSPLKTICEVPSELRTLTAREDDSARVNEKTTTRSSQLPTCSFSSFTQPQLQRRHKRRLQRRSLHTRVRRTLSCFNSRRPTRFHDLSDFDFNQTEMLQHCESFHSLHEAVDDEEQAVAAKSHTDASTETVAIAKSDKATETEIECVAVEERGVQVDDDMNPERVLACVPSQTRLFLNMLKESATQNPLELLEFNSDLLKRWQADKDFRNGLEILRAYALLPTNNNSNCNNNNEQLTAKNYEHFVNAMSCLHVLEELFKPFNVPILQQIEDHINEQLMNFHTKRMESEFYCTVYYPVKREIPQCMTSDYELLMANSV